MHLKTSDPSYLYTWVYTLRVAWLLSAARPSDIIFPTLERRLRVAPSNASHAGLVIFPLTTAIDDTESNPGTRSLYTLPQEK